MKLKLSHDYYNFNALFLLYTFNDIFFSLSAATCPVCSTSFNRYDSLSHNNS